MKSFAFLILVLGIVFTTIGYMELKFKNKISEKKSIEYRFIPRNIYEEQINPVNVKSHFNEMFEKLEPSSFNLV